MKIEIKNCNNIDEAVIEVQEKKLNIKYAMNGTGKSTIARAIELAASGSGGLEELTPFKHLDSVEVEDSPRVDGLLGTSSVLVFNDAYIEQFAFKKEELVTNSFEIFVKTADYDRHSDEIERIIQEIRTTFENSEEIDQVTADLEILSGSFGKSKKGYSAAGALAKGIGKGNKIANIPQGLEGYSEYLSSGLNAQWLRWQLNGGSFVDISNKCPYCTSPIEDKRETITLVAKEFDAKSIEHLNRILNVFESLSRYFTPEANKRLTTLTHNVYGLSEEEFSYLVGIKEQVDTLKRKMHKLKHLTFFSFRDATEVTDVFSELQINLDFLPELNSEDTGKLVTRINESLELVLNEVGKLQGEINQQKILIENTIRDNKSEINSFLRNAGYRYHVDVEYSDSEYRMVLRHADSSRSVSDSRQHLSYGERNALSLILFMYECLAKKPDVAILDDPISSFDRNKKYAVIDMLFRRKRSLKGTTVIMMTHDLEPVIDMLYNLPHKFEPVPFVTFLEVVCGAMREIPIARQDIGSFADICEENIRGSREDVVKLVYLRRYYEILGRKESAYELLSNLLHKRQIPIRKEGGLEVPMTAAEIGNASTKIQRKMPSFDYDALVSRLSHVDDMKQAYYSATVNYEKLQIFRILQDQFPESDVLNKFINETFHIENEYIMQLNPCKYEMVPSYIVDECDRLISEC